MGWCGAKGSAVWNLRGTSEWAWLSVEGTLAFRFPLHQGPARVVPLAAPGDVASLLKKAIFIRPHVLRWSIHDAWMHPMWEQSVRRGVPPPRKDDIYYPLDWICTPYMYIASKMNNKTRVELLNATIGW